MTAPAPIRLAIVNDYEIVVNGVAAVLDAYPERVTLVELDSQLPVAADIEVDVVLYDTFGQAQGDTMDVERLLNGSQARVVVFSWNTDAALVQRALRAGAAGYLSKDVDADQLVDALERVHRGELVLPAEDVTQDRFGRWPGDDLDLSPRESEVLALICQGLTNADISERAFIGVNTVKTHIRTLYRKIGVESRSQAVRWGLEHGFAPDVSRRRPEE